MESEQCKQVFEFHCSSFQNSDENQKRCKNLVMAIILFKQQKQTTQWLFIRWYFQFLLRIYPVTMLSDKLYNSNYMHSDSFSYLDTYVDISHLIKNLPSVWYCCLNWIGATTKLLYLFSSLFGKLLQRIARSLALLVLVSYYFFSKFSPLFSQSYNYCGLTPLSNELRQERSRSCITPGYFISKSAISIR